MAASIRIQPNGLVTDPSRLLAGDGGLIEANNVAFRAPGLVQPRAAIEYLVNEEAANTDFDTALHAREWSSGLEPTTVVALTSTDSDDLISIFRDDEPTPLIALTGEYDATRTRVYSELADGRMIWTLPNGLRCMDSQNDDPIDEIPGIGAFARMPGAPRIQGRFNYVPSSPAFLSAGETTAYRFTIVRWVTDASGRRIPVEGPPSDRYVVWNNSVNECGVEISAKFAGCVRPGDEVRVYRTPTNGVGGADPGDLMILRLSYTYEDGDPQVFSSIYDTLDGSEFSGPALYTNDGVEGPTRANYRIRTARDLASYQGKLFYGGGDAGWRQSTTLSRVGPAPVAQEIQRTLSSTRTATATADWGIGDTVVTNVPGAFFQYLAVGQYLTGGTTNGPLANATGLGGKIVSWDSGAGTITIDTEATGAGTNQHLIAWDWVGWANEFGDEYRVYAPLVVAGGSTQTSPATNAQGSYTSTEGVMPTIGGGTDGIVAGAVEWTFSDSYGPLTYQTEPVPVMYSATGADPNIGITITIEYDASFANPTNTNIPDEMSFYGLPRIAITSSKPLAFSTPVGNSYEDAVFANQDSPATLWWSKINQPESVPLGNFAIVGDSSQPISRILATTDRLWILKPDGLFTAYGAGDTAESITIQPVDSTFRMIDTAADEGVHARCSTWATKCRDTVFAWTRNGIFAIGSGGIRRVDGPIENDIRAITPSFNSTQAEASIGLPFCAASERDAIVVFGSAGIAGESALPGFCYVMHAESGMWATWTAPFQESDPEDYKIPSRVSGYGASVAGLLRLPMAYGYASYLDVTSNNSARTANTSLADDLFPVTGDRFFPAGWAANRYEIIGIDEDNPMLVTWTGVGGPPPVGSRFKDADGNWFVVISSTQTIIWTSLVASTDGDVNPVVGDLLDVHYAVPRVVTFSANQPPFTEKHFKTSYAHYQIIRAGTSFDVDWRARGHLSGEAPTRTVVYDDSYLTNPEAFPTTMSADLEFDQAISVPTQVARARGVELKITDTQADTWFAIDGLTLTYDAETERIERRR